MQRFLRGAFLVAVGMAPVVLSAHVFPISYGTLTLAQGIAQLRLRISVHNLHPALEAFTVEQGGQRSGLIFDARHPLLPLSPP